MSDRRKTCHVRPDGSRRYDPRETIAAAKTNGDLEAFGRIFELHQKRRERPEPRAGEST